MTEQSNTTRLNKRMAELGMCSRREADDWIGRGWVQVDGQVAPMGLQALCYRPAIGRACRVDDVVRFAAEGVEGERGATFSRREEIAGQSERARMPADDLFALKRVGASHGTHTIDSRCLDRSEAPHA